MKAELKRVALELLYTGGSVARKRCALMSSIKSQPISQEVSQLLVDVSVIIRGDVRTGIQRVVRAILSELQKHPPVGYRIVPVFASHAHGYRTVPDGFVWNGNVAATNLPTGGRVTSSAGDLFLGLDLATQELPRYQKQLERWKYKGVAIHVMVYDLLPVLNPEWFHSRTTHNFFRWLRTLAVVSDTVICISNSVNDDFEQWLKTKYSISSKSLPIKTISMGCDLESSQPSLGLPVDAILINEQLALAPSALMLGTLEPRKGHQIILNAFEKLWKQGYPYQLVIVGKPGWKTQQLQKQLNNHPERGKRLLWLDNVSDEYLSQIYQSTYGLIVASEGEGFGLPLVEAAAHGKPLLVRDLPVFRELNLHAMYFNQDDAEGLSLVIDKWFTQTFNLTNYNNQSKRLHWKDTVKELLSHINIDNRHYTHLTKHTDKAL